MRHVVILQEYIPEYRGIFFDTLISLGKLRGIKITIAAGAANRAQLARGDSIKPEWLHEIKQREVAIARRRLVLRKTRQVSKNADLIVMEQARRNTDSYRLFLPKPFQGPPIALWGHGGDFIAKNSAIDRFLHRQLTKRAAWFFAYTPAGLRLAVSTGRSTDSCTIVMNSIDTTNLARRIREARMKTPRVFDPVRPKAVFIGALDSSKRLQFLIESTEKIRMKIPNFSMVFAGDGPERYVIEEACARNPWMTFLGKLFEEEKISLLTNADFMMMPGRVGLVAVDSLASATPIATTQWEYHAPEFEYLSPGIDCMVSADNVESYVEMILKVINNPTLLDSLQVASFESSHKYSIESMAENFIAGIEDYFERR